MGIWKQLWANLRGWLVGSPPAKIPAIPPKVPPLIPTVDNGIPNPTWINQLLALHNINRQEAGVGQLTTSALLTADAQKHAEWMAQNKAMTHNGADGNMATRLRKTGYAFSNAGENVALGQSTPAEVVDEWMGSPGHRQNILNDRFSNVGFGYASDGKFLYWCTVLAAPMQAGLQRLLTEHEPRKITLPRPLIHIRVPLGYPVVTEINPHQ